MLINQVRDIIKGDKRFESLEEARESVTYETGIDVFDNLIGRKEEGIEKLGLDAGKILYIAGRSGSGKTTLAQQIATNIVTPFKNGNVIHFDTENSSDRTRIRKLSGWSIEDFNNKYLHLNEGITSESFYSMIKSIGDLKIENKKELSYETGFKNPLTGENEVALEPTVVILDSLSSLITGAVLDDDEIAAGMAGSRNAIVNAGIFRGIINTLNRANIILIVINHITDNIDINPMQRKKAQVNYLKQSESIPGGKVPVFLSNTFIKVDPGKKLKEDEEFGKRGFLVNLEIIKSRSNEAGRTASLVFFPSEGFSNVLTNFQFLVDNKIIKGTGRGYYIETMPDVKFRRKNLEEVYAENEEFRKEFDRYCSEMYTNLLISEVTEVEADKNEFESKLEPVEGHDDLYYHAESEKVYMKEEDGTYVEVEIS